MAIRSVQCRVSQPLKVPSASVQKEEHNFMSSMDFKKTMAKLEILQKRSWQGSTQLLTNCTNFFQNVYEIAEGRMNASMHRTSILVVRV